MPRHKGTPSRSLPAPVAGSSESPSKKQKTEPLDAIDVLFESYAEKPSGLIEDAGIETLCIDLHAEYGDIRMLILVWKMKAEKQGLISKDEWRRGFESLEAETIRKLRKEIGRLEKEVVLPEHFEDFYSYAFQYNLTDAQQPTLTIGSACKLLNVVLRHLYPAEVHFLNEYLKDQKEYDTINRDQWMSFYNFFKEVSLLNDDLQSFDSSHAPTIIKNFVEWFKETEKEEDEKEEGEMVEDDKEEKEKVENEKEEGEMEEDDEEKEKAEDEKEEDDKD